MFGVFIQDFLVLLGSDGGNGMERFWVWILLFLSVIVCECVLSSCGVVRLSSDNSACVLGSLYLMFTLFNDTYRLR